MGNYDVHILAVARVTIAKVTASNARAAIAVALAKVDLYEALNSSTISRNHQVEYDEDNVGYIVDALDGSGEPDIANARYFADQAHQDGVYRMRAIDLEPIQIPR